MKRRPTLEPEKLADGRNQMPGTLQTRQKEPTVPIYFLRIEVEILKGQAAWNDLVTRLCHPSAPSAPGDPVLRHRDAYAP